MIISPGRKYIFVHIPKTAGTSLALALEGRAMKDDIMMGDTPKAKKRRRRLKGVQASGRLWKHSRLCDIEGLVSAADIQSFMTFTLVRNPWDRVVSYYHWLREQSFDHAAVALAKQLEFGDFVLHPQTAQSLGATPFGSYMRLGPDEVPSLFIRIEDFAKDAQPLFDHLGFEIELPRVNCSDRQARYQEYYSPQTRQAIAEICQEDVARFGYEF